MSETHTIEELRATIERLTQERDKAQEDEDRADEQRFAMRKDAMAWLTTADREIKHLQQANAAARKLANRWKRRNRELRATIEGIKALL